MTVETFNKGKAVTRAIAHELRLQIWNIIKDNPGICVSDIYGRGDLPTRGLEQSVVSQHLIILKDANLVSFEKVGRHILYSISPANQDTMNLINEFCEKL